MSLSTRSQIRDDKGAYKGTWWVLAHHDKEKRMGIRRARISSYRFRALATPVVAALVGCLIAIAAAIWLINPTLAVPPGKERLALDRFLFTCDFSHRAKDDPIVHPGHAGMAHTHDFFANRSTSADSTYESLRAADSTCGHDEDTAAYWVPTLYQNGKALKPDQALLYYRARYDPELVKAFPPDLRMIAGDSRATSPQSTNVTAWWCAKTKNDMLDEPPRECPRGTRLALAVFFPNCWDGQHLDSPDHQSHMAYSRDKPCPSTHPVRTPEIALSIIYPTSRGTGLTFSSGSRYTAHADFINSWKQRALVTLVRRCINDQTRTSDDFCAPPHD
jgi:Domain of unknown function (DUF1996)